ncbi:hypothetical protein N9955_00335 [bacterium]|nr:hypothetical protein [bacterium]
MKTIVKKTITLETKRHDFDNEFAYIEVWSNAQLKDCYFAEKESLYPDGSVKNGHKKFFFSKFSGEDAYKEVKSIDYTKFKSFEKLYYYDEEGDILSIGSANTIEVEKDDYIFN